MPDTPVSQLVAQARRSAANQQAARQAARDTAEAIAKAAGTGGRSLQANTGQGGTSTPTGG